MAFSLLAAALLDRLGAVRVSAYSCGLAVPIFALAALVAGEATRWRLPTAAEAAALGYLAVILTVVGFLAWFTGLRRLGWNAPACSSVCCRSPPSSRPLCSTGNRRRPGRASAY
ncbi:EamA family transporter [Solwaraspora sp. WMMA2065]|uniref:EamA family transporter n=1 Tax=Solwaraspora sp. WMMA2065 TaxID=3015166 RepID=UPI00338D4CF2